MLARDQLGAAAHERQAEHQKQAVAYADAR
jgi:hypothetical protein